MKVKIICGGCRGSGHTIEQEFQSSRLVMVVCACCEGDGYLEYDEILGDKE